jgi:hypothetical protein
MEFYTNDDENYDEFRCNGGDQKWVSFTILLQNNNVLYLEDDEVIRTTTDFKPYEIVVETTNETFWKIHKCKYLTPSSILSVY